MIEFIGATIRLWRPLACAALGGVVSERAGVVNIALEGMLLAGAFASVWATKASGNLLMGVVAGVLAGALVGLLHAFFTLTLRVEHILSGVGLNLGLLGLTTFLLRLQPNTSLDAGRHLPDNVLTVVIALLVVGAWLLYARTALGLRLRACGENAQAARVAGIAVTRLRYGAVIASGALAGLGGVALALGRLGAFTENMTGGRGYIGLAAVIFGRWHPAGAALATLLFGFGDALQVTLQTAGWSGRIPPDFLTLLPYLVTLIALTVRRGGKRTGAPAGLGNSNSDRD